MSSTEVVDQQDVSQPIVRRKKVSGVSRPGYRTQVEFGEYGTLLFDESAAGGGEGAGPSPLHVVIGAVTEETAARLAEMVRETEARCPVYNLISDAGVKLETMWIRAGMGGVKVPSA